MKAITVNEMRAVEGGWSCLWGCKGHPKGQNIVWHYTLHLIGFYK